MYIRIESDNDREVVWMHGRGKEGEGYGCMEVLYMAYPTLTLPDIDLSCVFI